MLRPKPTPRGRRLQARRGQRCGAADRCLCLRARRGSVPRGRTAAARFQSPTSPVRCRGLPADVLVVSPAARCSGRESWTIHAGGWLNRPDCGRGAPRFWRSGGSLARHLTTRSSRTGCSRGRLTGRGPPGRGAPVHAGRLASLHRLTPPVSAAAAVLCWSLAATRPGVMARWSGRR